VVGLDADVDDPEIGAVEHDLSRSTDRSVRSPAAQARELRHHAERDVNGVAATNA
jgi:hypothetical protein